MTLGEKVKSTILIGNEEVKFLHERQHYKVYLCDESQTVFIVDKNNNTVLDEFWADGDDMACIVIAGNN